MPRYQYKITLDKTADRHGNNIQNENVTFECENHDDILEIIQRIQSHPTLTFDGDERIAFAVGLKLFGETLLKHKHDPVFEPLKGSFKEFMKGLKSGIDPS
jgi:hypothetical protein